MICSKCKENAIGDTPCYNCDAHEKKSEEPNIVGGTLLILFFATIAYVGSIVF